MKNPLLSPWFGLDIQILPNYKRKRRGKRAKGKYFLSGVGKDVLQPVNGRRTVGNVEFLEHPGSGIAELVLPQHHMERLGLVQHVKLVGAFQSVAAVFDNTPMAG